ncbi:MAG TPA: hypothetical protein DCM05_12730 [Elusimicrobia bacterium]|nr:hypothetical protein [Elusimicrobiota bacterium]
MGGAQTQGVFDSLGGLVLDQIKQQAFRDLNPSAPKEAGLTEASRQKFFNDGAQSMQKAGQELAGAQKGIQGRFKDAAALDGRGIAGGENSAMGNLAGRGGPAVQVQQGTMERPVAFLGQKSGRGSASLSRGGPIEASDTAPAKAGGAKNAAEHARNADAAILSDRWNDALNSVNAGLRQAPGDAKLLGRRALALNLLGRYAEAREAAKDAIAANPKLWDAWYSLAVAEAGLGNRRESLAALEQAAQLNPEQVGPLYEKALQLPETGDLLALLLGREAVPGAPGASRFWKYLALVLLGLGGGAVAVALALRRRRIAGPTRASLAASISALAGGERALPSGYRLVRPMGSGGMGAVYEAVDVALERRVALKRMREEIRREKSLRARFAAEARLVAKLKHPNIIEIFSVIDEGDDLCLVFEFVDGHTLHALRAEAGKLSFERCRHLLRQACAGLGYAHRSGVIHRDLKPANIMVSREGQVKLMDFGVARQVADALSVTGTVAGTPRFMAPEMEGGVVRRESDLYSLALCFYEMLAGEPAFGGSAMASSKREMEFAPVSRKAAGLPSGIDTFFARALQVDPERRFATAEELSAAFDALKV